MNQHGSKPAFPVESTDHERFAGLTITEYFAAHAPENCDSYLSEFVFDEPEPQKPEGYAYCTRGGSADRETLLAKCREGSICKHWVI